MNRYLAALDMDFAYEVAVTLSEDTRLHNSSFGDRTAGSEAEHAAAEWLSEKMREIGLSDVEKVAVKCDRWTFRGAGFQIQGDERVIMPHSYAAPGTPGIRAEVVYLGRGAAADYAGIDAAGKIVLIDIDQRANWWITYPMLEAYYRGAAAIMSSESGGFSEISEDAYNAQDLCGPARIPCVSITRSDAAYVKERLSKGPVVATLTVDNEVAPGDGVSYNVIGRIPGKSSERQIVVGSHYDMHFRGFQDDCCGVSLTLTMAKALVDSGFRGENDIVFCLHGAEEWGASGSMFDWTVGAWEMIFNGRPDWRERTILFMNFELPAYQFADYTLTNSPPELYKMLADFANSPFAPKPDGCFPDGVLTEGYMSTTFSDDFSYLTAGVPSIVNGFMFQKDMRSVFPYYVNIYHSNYDTRETYNERVMAFNAKYYGSLLMWIDGQKQLPLDFSAQGGRLAASVDERIMSEAGVDTAAYLAAARKMRAEAPADLFRLCQDAFLGLMYDRPIVPHEAPQENIALMEAALELLKVGDGDRAADEYAWRINNGLEWYAMQFSSAVTAAQDQMLYGEKTYWGTGRMFKKANVEEATRGLTEKYGKPGADFTKEIAIYRREIKKQRKILKALAEKEMRAMAEFAGGRG